MSWETRKRGTRYYTRSKWVDGRVTRSYIGASPMAEVIAQLDELKRLEKEEEALRFKEEQERLGRSAGFLAEVEEAAKILTSAYLVASGAHRHKGTWRFRRT